MNTKLLAATAAAVVMTAGAAAAQAPATSADGTTAYSDAAVPVEEDDGMDLGWIGLLGLAGLLGLRKRREEDVRTHPATTSTLNR